MCQTRGGNGKTDKQTNDHGTVWAMLGTQRHTMASASEGEKDGFLEETLELKSEGQSQFNLIVVFYCYTDSTGVNKIKHL